ncbi:MAG: GNAT family N-acetyltransferase [Ferruginibacter sp.]
MMYREATTNDIKQIQLVRNAVKENALSNPGLVTDRDCVEYLTLRGKGWVCDKDGTIIGFAIADLIDNNIWALFVHPDYAEKGVGKTLHNMMLNWYFEQKKENVWLSTAPGTRAEKFYRMQGWTETGIYGKGEIKFEMSKEQWFFLNSKTVDISLRKQLLKEQSGKAEKSNNAEECEANAAQ